MRSLFVGVSLLVLGLNVSAQSQCDFLKNLKFKNGRDTIIVKAVLRDFLLAPPRTLFKKPPAIYKYKFDSNILFQPENCDRNYEMPVISSRWVDPENILNSDNLGLTVYLTCVVFNESALTRGQPDCLVIKIKSAIQSPIAFPEKCNFLSNLHFNNGIDTILIKAKYHGHYKPGIGLILTDLSKRHFLNGKDYENGIGFQVPGCDEKIIAPYHSKTGSEEQFLERQPEDGTIYLTCITFQNYYSYGMPFFVIENFKFAK
ncbi:MAG: hypothetical protein JST19_08220 [Bacteroidetes bacterium]|nr:hypothetical protein [Bacteroidota bacterium]